MKSAILILGGVLSFCTLGLFSCEKGNYSNPFEYSKPVDLSPILHAYDWHQRYEGDDKDSILYTMIAPDLPREVFRLFEDTTFVLRVANYTGSDQPFLANAEDFYNSCALTWNVWSNYEVWYRMHTANYLCNDDEIVQSIKSVSVDIIKNKDVRLAARHFKDSLLLAMGTPPDGLDENYEFPIDLLMSFSGVIESKAYKFYDDEESFVDSLDSITTIAESMAKDKFQRYLDANEDEQVHVMLNELATCRNFDEQCSLWRSWANCEKSVIDEEWIIAVGRILMRSGLYSPILHRVWLTWRALSQVLYFGSSKDSSIPNNYYNEYRKMCYITCLKHIENFPDDIFAMNCAAVLGGRTNMNRFGQNNFGNEAMTEEMMIMPNRYRFDDDEEDDDDENENSVNDEM